jgi:hypothetical protein
MIKNKTKLSDMKKSITVSSINIIDFSAQREFGYYYEGELEFLGKIEIEFTTKDDLRKYVNDSYNLKKKKLQRDILSGKIKIKLPETTND